MRRYVPLPHAIGHLHNSELRGSRNVPTLEQLCQTFVVNLKDCQRWLGYQLLSREDCWALTTTTELILTGATRLSHGYGACAEA